MRFTHALVVLSLVGAGGCCRRACCPPPVRAAAQPPQPAPSSVLPPGALEATLHYARGAAAARTHPALARAAWEEALALLGKEPGPARLESFRDRIRARLAGRAPVHGPASEPMLQVQILDVTD